MPHWPEQLQICQDMFLLVSLASRSNGSRAVDKYLCSFQWQSCLQLETQRHSPNTVYFSNWSWWIVKRPLKANHPSFQWTSDNHLTITSHALHQLCHVCKLFHSKQFYAQLWHNFHVLYYDFTISNLYTSISINSAHVQSFSQWLSHI